MGRSFNIDPLTTDEGGMLILTHEQGTTTTIELVGECDLAHRQDLRATIRRVLADQPERLVLDLTRLSFIDSSGIHIIIELSQRAARTQCQLLICPGPPAVQRVFELCGLSTRLPFLPHRTPPQPEPRDALTPLTSATASGGSGSLPAAHAAGRTPPRPAAPTKPA
jgi:anti-sigma B factor antagonist